MAREGGFNDVGYVFLCHQLPDTVCTMVCEWCDHEPSKQPQCQCVPQPNPRMIERQLYLAAKERSMFGKVTSNAQGAIDVSVDMLMRSVSRNMSMPNRVFFWDSVAKHFPV